MTSDRDTSAAPGSFATRRPVGVFMVFLAAVVFGVFSCARLPVTLMPELTYPTDARSAPSTRAPPPKRWRTTSPDPSKRPWG